MSMDFTNSPWDIENFYDGTHDINEISQVLEVAREKRYHCMIANYVSSFSLLQIYLWERDYGQGHILVAKGCGYIQGYTRWAPCQLTVEHSDNPEEYTFKLVDAEASVEITCESLFLAKDVEF